MTESGEATTLIIFARAPIPGEVKTRLIPTLGVQGATALYRRLLHNTLELAGRSGFQRIELCCTPDSEHEEFRSLAGRYPLMLSQQQGQGLGHRMYQAMAQALRHCPRVILIGSDCPQLTLEDLQDARNGLTRYRPLVIGPAHDGGYVLIGARKLDPSLFADIPWGTSRVLSLTRRRISRLGWRWRELRTFQDIDRPRDLRALPAGWVGPEWIGQAG